MSEDEAEDWVERNWWLLSAGNVSRPTGPERVREAINRDRGHYAPSAPLTLCGQPDGTEQRADSRAVRPLAPLPLWLRVANRLVAPIAKVLGF